MTTELYNRIEVFRRDIAETAILVNALRIILRTDYASAATEGAKLQAWDTLKQAGIAKEGGLLDIPPELAMLVYINLKGVGLFN